MAQLAVVIPAWNERPNLEALLPQVRRTLEEIGVEAEIIVADAGSADGTAEAVRALGARVVVQHERGYGGALLAGFDEATAPYVVTMDADLSHPPTFIRDFWRRREDAELLIASRFVPGGRAETSGFRLLLSRILNGTFRALLRLPVRDLSSGYRFYRRDMVKGLAPAARDFDFLQEVLIRLYNNGARVLEIPFHYRPRGAGRSHARLLRFGWAYAKTLLRMWRLRHGR
ncbi:MAG: glycosyltransferase [Bryobacteraceae bacterium]